MNYKKKIINKEFKVLEDENIELINKNEYTRKDHYSNTKLDLEQKQNK